MSSSNWSSPEVVQMFAVERRPRHPYAMSLKAAQRFIGAVKAGSSLETAAGYADLEKRTVYRWIARGLGRDPKHPATPPYIGFARQFEQARAGAHAMASGNLLARSKYDTKAGMEWLRRFGGPEWRGGTEFGADLLADPVPPAPATTTSAFSMMTAEVREAFVHELLVRRRAEREREDAEASAPPVSIKRRPSRYVALGLAEDSVTMDEAAPAEDSERPHERAKDG